MRDSRRSHQVRTVLVWWWNRSLFHWFSGIARMWKTGKLTLEQDLFFSNLQVEPWTLLLELHYGLCSETYFWVIFCYFGICVYNGIRDKTSAGFVNPVEYLTRNVYGWRRSPHRSTRGDGFDCRLPLKDYGLWEDRRSCHTGISGASRTPKLPRELLSPSENMEFP